MNIPHLPLRRLALVAMLLSSASGLAWAGPGSNYIASYVRYWLNEHKVESSVDERFVVTIPGHDFKFYGELPRSTEQGRGKFLVLARLSIGFNDGRHIGDTVTGMGNSAPNALVEAMSKFTQTTFHPVYAAFVDGQDPHVQRRTVQVGGVKRTVFLSGWDLSGQLATRKAPALDSLLDQVLASLSDLPLSGQAHWARLQVATAKGQVDKLLFTLDDQPDEGTAGKLRALPWPAAKQAGLLHLFLVVAPSEQAPAQAPGSASAPAVDKAPSPP